MLRCNFTGKDSSMTQARKGNKVRVSYTGRLEDGTIFDASEECDGCYGGSGPLEFTIGDGSVISGFDAAVIGMSPGDNKTVIIDIDDAYGPHLEELVAEIDRKDVPEGMNPEPGQHLEIVQEQGQTFPVVVIGVTPEKITLDANHPLAGRELTFDIRLDALL
jgi:peptidylprolyl isomerase